MMMYHKVQSSNIDSVAWLNDTLFIRFHHGGEYAYDGVPHNVFEDMLKAPSVGKFFHAEVKNKFEYRRLEEAA
jgi:hypothetical protein